MPKKKGKKRVKRHNRYDPRIKRDVHVHSYPNPRYNPQKAVLSEEWEKKIKKRT